MDLGKHGDSDGSKQEEEKPSDDVDNTGVGRSYECTFCKRGFTNAQALGGHMNIHRKDKAKAKAKQKSQLETINKSKEDHFMQQVSASHHHRQIGYQRAQVNYQVYLPSSNPSFQTGNYLPLRFDNDASLCLRVGAPPPADGDHGGRVVDCNVEENEVDLELRLGHDP